MPPRLLVDCESIAPAPCVTRTEPTFSGLIDAADVQAVVIAVAHVAQRDTVEVEAELALAEAADGDAGRPFVVAERIRGLDVDAGQLLDRLDQAGAGRERDEILSGDFLHLAGFALAENDDFVGGLEISFSGLGIGLGKAGWARNAVETRREAVILRIETPMMVRCSDRGG